MTWYQTPLAQGLMGAWAVLAWGSLIANAWLARQRGLNAAEWALWGYLLPMGSTLRLLRKPQAQA